MGRKKKNKEYVELDNGFRFTKKGKLIRYEHFKWKEYSIRPERRLELMNEHFPTKEIETIKETIKDTADE